MGVMILKNTMVDKTFIGKIKEEIGGLGYCGYC
jgi:hypothetical protein